MGVWSLDDNERHLICLVHLSDNGSQGLSTCGGIPTPNWDALADIDAVGGVTRSDVVPQIIEQLSAASTNVDVEFHARRLQSLKALTYAPSANSDVLSRLYEIVFGILEKVGDTSQKRKKGILGAKGGDKEITLGESVELAKKETTSALLIPEHTKVWPVN